MRRAFIKLEYWNHKLVVANRTIKCDGSGWGNTFEELNRSCDNCPIRFRCLTSADTIILETEEEFDKVVDFIQGR